MVICSLPYDLCSQRYHYRNDLGMKQTATGLRQDMREWIAEYCDDQSWNYNLVYNDIDFVFPTRGLAALFVLHWSKERSLMADPPVPRPGGDFC